MQNISHDGVFTVFPSGATQADRVDELGGSTLAQDNGTAPLWVRVATVRMFADVDRPVHLFSLTPSSTGVASYGRGTISWAAVSLDSVSIGTPGAGDLDADGDVDQADLALFVNVLLGVDSDAGHVARADMNGDNARDGRDIAGFVGAMVGH